MKVTFVVGDITEQNVDAIVNAANKWLIRGSGVCGAIHKAAGPELEAYCKTLNGCATGEAKITPGFNLPAKFVIHTVGPRCGQENGCEAALLASCYRNSLLLAEEYGLWSICFPAISTGVYGYPVEEAAEVVARSLVEFERDNPNCGIENVSLIFRSEILKDLYQKAYTFLGKSHRL